MGLKTINHPVLGQLVLQRRRGTRSLRLRTHPKHGVVLSLPFGVSERLGLKFAEKHKDWIDEHRGVPLQLIPGQRIGQATITLGEAPTARAYATASTIKLSVPFNQHWSDPAHQDRLQKAAIRSLVAQANEQLLPRLQEIAELTGKHYNSASINQMRSRWGSCNSQRTIKLSCYLQQLPDHLIDYVIVHELCHLDELNHSAGFWETVATVLPDYRDRRKALQQFQPQLIPDL